LNWHLKAVVIFLIISNAIIEYHYFKRFENFPLFHNLTTTSPQHTAHEVTAMMPCPNRKLCRIPRLSSEGCHSLLQ